MSRSRIRLAAVVAAGLLLTACGGADDTAGEDSTASTSPDAGEGQADDADSDRDTTGGDMDDDMDDDDDMGDMGDMGDMSRDYGKAAEASEAERTIEVAVDNTFAFDPAEYQVAAGEVVTFQITNTGDIEHEFVLGDEQAQQQMAEDMADEMDQGDGHAHSGEMSNAVTIHGGEQAELTWRFPDDATTVLVGCHLPGHWDAGMRASVTVG